MRQYHFYPIAIRLKEKTVLVIGGGQVAERKIHTLRESGSRITVISPYLTLRLKQLAEAKKITWVRGRFQPSQQLRADLVIASTSDQAVNRQVRHWTQKKRILINVVDQSQLSDFISPAVFRAQKAIVAVYTDAKDPVLSRDLKNFLKENWDVFLSYRHRLQKRAAPHTGK